jgi:predicted PurR-regulated permease PerM
MPEKTASGDAQGRLAGDGAADAVTSTESVPVAPGGAPPPVQTEIGIRVAAAPAAVQRDRQRQVMVAVAAAIAIWFLFQVREILPPFIVAGLLAALLDPTVRHMEKSGRSRLYSVLVLYVFFIAMFGVVIVSVGPRVMEEVQDVSKNSQVYYQHVENTANRFLKKNARLLSMAGVKENRLDALVSQRSGPVKHQIDEALGALTGFLSNAASKAIWLIIIPIATFFLLRDYPTIRARAIGLFPTESQPRLDAMSRQIVDVFIAYLRGLVKLCIVYGIASYFVFLVLGLNYALFMAIMAGLFYTIPYIGPFLTAAVVGVVAYSMDAHTALLFWHVPANSMPYAITVIVIQIAVNQVFDQVVFPRIVGESVGLHPVVTIFALMAGATMFSVWGMLLAVPVAASIQIIVAYSFPRVSQPPPEYLLAEPEPLPDTAPAQ